MYGADPPDIAGRHDPAVDDDKVEGYAHGCLSMNRAAISQSL